MMLGEVHKCLLGLFSMLLFAVTAHAQYTVTGGTGTPRAFLNKENLEVYLVYGMTNVEIRYSSASTSHQWFRYKTNPVRDSEPVSSTQEGMSSVISNIEEGYGYYVRESETIGMNKCVWIIDYSKYAFDIQNLRVQDGDNQCTEIGLTGTLNMPALYFYFPGGTRGELVREIDVIYSTMENRPEQQRFVEKDTLITVEGNPFNRYYPAPYTDTDFTIRGDQFARYFSVEKSASTDIYQAVAVKAVGDTTLLSIDGKNILSGEGESLSAPAEIHFFAYANEPVASIYDWVIYNKEDESRRSLVSSGLNDLTYTFNQYGTYVAQLQVSSRSGNIQCTDSTFSVEIKIRESDLKVPNAFSPGASPGINDEFKVAYKSLISFKGWIFNRWGNQLFHWTDPAKGWDGKKGGKYVPPGVYFYVIEAKGSDGENYNVNGHINIIRPKNVQDQIVE